MAPRPQVEPLEGLSPEAAWRRFCGFFSLDATAFQQIQEGLLLEELQLLNPTPFGASRLGAPLPRTVAEFRAGIPFSTYEDYAPLLDAGAGERLPGYLLRAQTTHRGPTIKWVPYTERAYVRLLNDLLAAFILAAAKESGDIRARTRDRVLLNLPPTPYLSGYLAHSLVDDLRIFRSVRPLHDGETQDFSEKVAADFRAALSVGFDHLVALASVLDTVARRFSEERGRTTLSVLRQPRLLARMVLGTLRARLEGRRNVLPRDLWRLKGIVTWGLDSRYYAPQIREAWGQDPLQVYASTEGGILAMQSWGKQGMTFLPYTVFLEFIPAAEWTRSRQDPAFIPSTRLYHELTVGDRYEMVVTSFYGMPFLRYRVGHLVRVVSDHDQASGSRLPQVVMEGRADDIVDIAGFTRLDGQTVGRAMESLGVRVAGWAVTKEVTERGEVLHIFIEPKDELSLDQGLTERLHQALKKLDPFYADMEGMLGLRPLRVSVLARGTLQEHLPASERGRGREPFTLINPPEEDVRRLRERAIAPLAGAGAGP